MERESERLNKFISDAGVSSRREADRLIEDGKVEIRRHSRKDEPEKPRERARLGDRVYHGDTVYVNGTELPKKKPERVYYLYHKPAGIICTADRNVEGNILDAVSLPQHVTYAGRLDKDSSGLMLLTNDGDLIEQMMRASAYHEKEYLVTVGKVLTPEFLERMGSGVKILIDDEATKRKYPDGRFVTTRPCRVRAVSEKRFRITLTQGYNRQIRRMCRALGYPVSAIERLRIVNLRLGDLKEGRTRKLSEPEIRSLQDALRRTPKKDAVYVSRKRCRRI